MALFFVTFLPQFLPADNGSPRADALLLSAVFAMLYVAWFATYVVAVARLGTWLRQAGRKARIERVTRRAARRASRPGWRPTGALT